MPARLLALALCALLTAGCATTPAVAPSVTVDVTQGRTDKDGRVIVMDVTNTGSTPVELVGARLDTAQFTEPAEWSRGTTLAPGRTVSLRAPLADPVCPVPAAVDPVVTIAYADESGGVRESIIEPTQSTGVLQLIAREDCMAVLAALSTTLTVSEAVTWTPGARTPAELTIVAEPTGRGSLEILAARSTILLSIVDASGAKLESLPLDVAVAAGTEAITLRLVPSRCDPHAIAEDKRGTIMQLDVRLDDATEGLVYVRSSDATKADLFAFVTDYCAPGT